MVLRYVLWNALYLLELNIKYNTNMKKETFILPLDGFLQDDILILS